MKKTKLKPYVHKIKGARNYALYNLLKGDFYILSPGGSVEDLKKALEEAGLIFEPGGTVPFKTTLDLKKETRKLLIRELQVKLNGRSEFNCLNRIKIDSEKRVMEMETLLKLNGQIKDIPVKTIRVEAETDSPGQIEYILNEFQYEEVVLLIETGVDDSYRDRYKHICEKRQKTFTLLLESKRDMQELKVKIYEFFYNQNFNPCLGQQVAVDCSGEIKPCLWWKNALGSIHTDHIIDMIQSEVFDKYWELTKDKIEVCKDCELRYACLDCRLSYPPQCKAGDFLYLKPYYCAYNPYTGKHEILFKDSSNGDQFGY